VTEYKADCGSKKAYQREQERAGHSAWDFRVSENFISHDDKRREDKKEKPSDLRKHPKD
jgi:hypothetical protein